MSLFDSVARQEKRYPAVCERRPDLPAHQNRGVSEFLCKRD